MKAIISRKCGKVKNYTPYIIEWWAHNICFFLTLPFIKKAKIKMLNERFKHVDLDVEVIEE